LYDQHEIVLDPDVLQKAKRSLDRMLSV